MISSLSNFLTQTARSYPNKVAVVAEERRVTYAEIDRDSDAMAAYLQSMGVERGDRVVTCLENTVESIVAFWAVQKIGAVISPVDSKIKHNKLRYILCDSGAKILVTTTEQVKDDDCEASFTNSSIEHVLLIGDVKNSAKFSSLNYVLACQELPKNSGVIDLDLAAIIYTSGSTGEPKGVMLTHRNMIAATESVNAYLEYAEHDIIACALPLSFDYGLYQMIIAFSVGARLILEKNLIWPAQMLKNIVREQATILPVVPTIVDLLREHYRLINCNLSSIRKVTNTGATLTLAHIKGIKELFPGVAIYSMYGLTECKRCTFLPPQDIDRKPTSVGIAIPNTELWLIDEAGNKLGANQVGQLVIRGATVMKGYWNKPEQTAEKLKNGSIPDEKVLYTGDYCLLDEEGYLYFKGRIDHVVKIRGIKVSPVEIESFISSINAVKEVAVLAASTTEQENFLCAFVAGEAGIRIDTRSIKEQCRLNMEVYKRPEYVIQLKALPKTPNGKIDKIALQEQLTNFLQIADSQSKTSVQAYLSSTDKLKPKSDDMKNQATDNRITGKTKKAGLTVVDEPMKQSLYQRFQSQSVNCRELQLKLREGTIAAKVWGEPDSMPVIAIHGWLDNANSFDKIADKLNSIQLVALDLPGHGYSYHRSSGVYCIWDYVYDILEVADQLGWKQFGLLGHSMGSGVAVLTAGAFPERVTHLVLIDGLGPPFTTPAVDAAKHLAKAVRHHRMVSSLAIYGFSKDAPMFTTHEEAVKARMQGVGGTLTKEAATLLVERQIEDVSSGYRWRSDPLLTVHSFLQMSEEQVHAFIKAIICPTSIILGDRGLFAEGQMDERLDFFQNFTKHVLPGGHHLHMEESALEIVCLLYNFFNKI